MALYGYFDESARTEAGEPLCVAGYLFKQAKYKQFVRYWKKNVLQHAGRTYSHFHTVDLCAGQEEYKGVSLSERVDILNKAVDGIRRFAYAGIAVEFHQAEFELAAPPEWPDYRGSIYSNACHLCLQATGGWLKTWRSPDTVLYVFERGHKFQAQADVVFRAIADDDNARRQFRYRNHLFEDKRMAAGLQAGDILAWILTKAEVANGRAPRAMKPFVPAFLRLAKGDRVKVHRLTGEKLTGFLKNQMDVTEETGFPVDFAGTKRGFR